MVFSKWKPRHYKLQFLSIQIPSYLHWAQGVNSLLNMYFSQQFSNSAQAGELRFACWTGWTIVFRAPKTSAVSDSTGLGFSSGNVAPFTDASNALNSSSPLVLNCREDAESAPTALVSCQFTSSAPSRWLGCLWEEGSCSHFYCWYCCLIVFSKTWMILIFTRTFSLSYCTLWLVVGAGHSWNLVQ